MASARPIVLALSAAYAAASTTESPPQVMTSHGPVLGTSVGGVSAFYGIPYASPPVGDLRFRPPEQPEAWSVPKDVSTAPKGKELACLQVTAGMNSPSTVGTEDCLKIFAYSPELPSKPGAKSLAPVMLWIHGGAFATGDAWVGGLYNGTTLAQRHGLVVFVAQYRLGTLGFLGLEPLQQEDAHRSTGNYGVMDQRAAMRWAQENAAAFGGDPARVTIFGESAGGESMCYHLASPASKGLFAAVIMESGSCDLQFDTVLARQQSWRVVDHLHNCTWGSADYLRCLRSIDAGIIQGLISFDVTHDRYKVGPTIDGTEVGLPDMPSLLLAAGKVNRVPVIMGTNGFEYQFNCFSPADVTECFFLGIPGLNASVTEFRARLEGGLELKLSDAQWAQVLAEYPLSDYHGSTGARLSAIATDAGFAGPKGRSMHIGECGTLRAGTDLARAGAPVWMYRFNSLGATTFMQHGGEIPYVFGNWDDTLVRFAGPQPVDFAVSAVIGRYWANLASFQDPNGAGGGETLAPQWPALLASAPRIATFEGAEMQLKPPERARFCQFWQALLGASTRGAGEPIVVV